MSAKHTAGPWQVGGQFGTATFVNAGTICVAKCDGKLHAANARLIAAAPELLEALKAVVIIADRATVEFDAAKAAISKATGDA